MATGMPRSLPMTSSAAPAISSATQTSVATSSRPPASTRALEVDDCRHSRTPDRDIGDPAPPRPAERVRDDHADIDAERVAERRPESPRREVGVLGEERGGPVGHVGKVDAGVGADEPVPCLADDELTATAQDPHRFPFDQCGLGLGVRVIELDQPPFGLRDDLLGHHEDITVPEPGPLRRRRRQRRSDQVAQVGARGHLADPGHREHGEGLSVRHRAPPWRGPAARSGELMTVGATTQRTPSASTAAACAASASSMTSVPTHDAYSRATPTTEASVPSSRSIRSAGPFRAAPATIGETATTSGRRLRRRVLHARHREHRPDGDHRVGGTDHDRSRVLERVQHARRGTGGRGALEAHASHGHVVREPDEVVLEADLRACGAEGARLRQRDAGAQGVVGHRQQVHGDAPPFAQRRRHRAEGLAGGETTGAEEVGGQVPVAQPEPVLPAQPGEFVHHGPGLARHSPSGLAVVHAGQRVRDGVEIGADRKAVQDHVVTDVDDRRDLLARNHADQAGEHSSGPDAAAQGHQHATSIGARRGRAVRRPWYDRRPPCPPPSRRNGTPRWCPSCVRPPVSTATSRPMWSPPAPASAVP